MDKYQKIFFEQLSDKQIAQGVTIENMRPLTHAKVNDHDITLILDTGATNTFLSYEWLEEHNLAHHCKRVYTYINDVRVECLIANLHVCVGNKNKELNICVRLDDNWKRFQFDGCLGMDLLIDMPFTLNLVNRELSQWGITKPPLTEISITNTLIAHTQKYSSDDNRPSIYISDSTYNYFPVLFDTGCQKSTISNKSLPNLKIDTEKEPRPEFDTLGRMHLRQTAKKMTIFIQSNLVQPFFAPFIANNEMDDILGIDLFNGFIVKHYGDYIFEVTGNTHPPC